MTTVAFIGLGTMGAPMAANLVKAGYDVVGYNRTPDRVQALVDAGGRGADDADTRLGRSPGPRSRPTATTSWRCYGTGKA